MRNLLLSIVLSITTWPFGIIGQAQTRILGPETPEVRALRERHAALMAQAKEKVKIERFEEGIALLRQASELADAIPGGGGIADLELAELFVRLHRDDEALGAYRRVFRWNPQKGDLQPTAGPSPEIDYALLLAKTGRIEDAKAMYYYALRVLSEFKYRGKEPVPFVVVFDPEPEGIAWEYSPVHFEAAARMIQFMANSSREGDAERKRICELAPDWFYPVLWHGNDNRIARAEALAKPGLEREFVARFKADLNAYRAEHPEDKSLRGFYEQPFTEGAERRARMQCLRPNPEILKRLCRPSQ